MKRYSEYKDSGIAWIGEIPKHWYLSRIDSLFYRRKEKNTNIVSNNILSVLKDIGVIRYVDKGNIGNKVSDNIEKYQLVYVGDIVLNSMNVTIGSVGRSNHFGALSGIYIVLAAKNENVNMDYYEYVFKVSSFQKSLSQISSGILEIRESLNFTEFKTLKLLTPSSSEQVKIANFLDRKTEQIDELIRIKERQIELLQEQRTALINHAVTKGLDPNVEMKPSGVEWIGEIPKHWEVEKIKDNAVFVSEKSTPETDSIKISPENVESDTGRILNYYSSYDSLGVKFQNGDVLFNKIRVYLSKVVYSEFDGYSLGEMIVIRPTSQCMGKYLFYLMISNHFIEYCDSISYGAECHGRLLMIF